MAAVFSRLPMRVRCATQRDHVFHPEMNYSQTQLASLIGSPSGGWPTISRRARTSKKDKELVTLELYVAMIDIATRLIRNEISLVLALLGIASQFASPMQVTQSLIATTILLLLLLVIYQRG